jgi:Protein of unknown function (DUF1579)
MDDGEPFVGQVPDTRREPVAQEMAQGEGVVADFTGLVLIILTLSVVSTMHGDFAMRALLPFIMVLFLAVIADDPPVAKKEDQSKFEPRTLPGEGQKFLERFAGEWDLEKTTYPRAGAPVRAEGRCRQTMIHGGRFLQSEFVFGRGSEEFGGTGTIGFEPERCRGRPR